MHVFRVCVLPPHPLAGGEGERPSEEFQEEKKWVGWVWPPQPVIPPQKVRTEAARGDRQKAGEKAGVLENLFHCKIVCVSMGRMCVCSRGASCSSCQNYVHSQQSRVLVETPRLKEDKEGV